MTRLDMNQQKRMTLLQLSPFSPLQTSEPQHPVSTRPSWMSVSPDAIFLSSSSEVFIVWCGPTQSEWPGPGFMCPMNVITSDVHK